jgi:hypothetical protein
VLRSALLEAPLLSVNILVKLLNNQKQRTLSYVGHSLPPEAIWEARRKVVGLSLLVGVAPGSSGSSAMGRWGIDSNPNPDHAADSRPT